MDTTLKIWTKKMLGQTFLPSLFKMLHNFSISHLLFVSKQLGKSLGQRKMSVLVFFTDKK